jgi:hypothetical protein
MSKRHNHSFQFKGFAISQAAKSEADYHDKRALWWTGEQEKAVAKLKEATVQVTEHEVTGGKNVVAGLHVDPHAQMRANECAGKVQSHQRARDRFLIEAGAYGTHPDFAFDLDAEDVVYFRLAGGTREE